VIRLFERFSSASKEGDRLRNRLSNRFRCRTEIVGFLAITLTLQIVGDSIAPRQQRFESPGDGDGGCHGAGFCVAP
jgi:hypothetical protein